MGNKTNTNPTALLFQYALSHIHIVLYKIFVNWKLKILSGIEMD